MSGEASDSSSLKYEPAQQDLEKKVLYHNIKMNMQEIQRLAHEVDNNVKKIREDIDITATLLAAIQTHSQDKD